MKYVVNTYLFGYRDFSLVLFWEFWTFEVAEKIMSPKKCRRDKLIWLFKSAFAECWRELERLTLVFDQISFWWDLWFKINKHKGNLYYAAMLMMTSQILKSAGLTKTHKSRYLENETYFFFIQNSLITHCLLFYDKD